MGRRSVHMLTSYALLVDSLLGGAWGFAVPGATLDQLVQQNTITLEKNELNPYGLFPITFNHGKLVKGNLLATNWNDAQNNPGQGRTILQVTPQGATQPFATIDPNHPLVQANCGNIGVGLTMALVILSRGYVVVGSTPIPIGGTVAGPGCLILLDAHGHIKATAPGNQMTSSNVMTGGGPWAMAVQEHHHGAKAHLFVSYVLGDMPSSTATLTGVHGGKVARYELHIPDDYSSDYSNFWGYSIDIVAAGFPTQPGNIGGGFVGPTGLLLGSPTQGSFSDNTVLQNRPLFIANNLNNSLVVVTQSDSCSTLSGTSYPCNMQTVAWGGLINGPIGLALSPAGSIVGANGGIGTLFEVAPTPGLNLQLADQLVDNTGAAVGAGTLFNVMFHPLVPHTLFFNDDGMNSFNTLTRPRWYPSSRKMM